MMSDLPPAFYKLSDIRVEADNIVKKAKKGWTALQSSLKDGKTYSFELD